MPISPASSSEHKSNPRLTPPSTPSTSSTTSSKPPKQYTRNGAAYTKLEVGSSGGSGGGEEESEARVPSPDTSLASSFDTNPPSYYRAKSSPPHHHPTSSSSISTSNDSTNGSTTDIDGGSSGGEEPINLAILSRSEQYQLFTHALSHLSTLPFTQLDENNYTSAEAALVLEEGDSNHRGESRWERVRRWIHIICLEFKVAFLNTLHLFHSPHIRNSLKLTFTWFLLSFGYYGLTLWIPQYFAGDDGKSSCDDTSSDGTNDNSNNDDDAYLATVIGALARHAATACATPRDGPFNRAPPSTATTRYRRRRRDRRAGARVPPTRRTRRRTKRDVRACRAGRATARATSANGRRRPPRTSAGRA